MTVTEVAKRVGKSGYLSRCTDAPINHTLMSIQARREAQKLNQMLRRVVIVVVCIVFDDESHILYFKKRGWF
jgi:hypothetical protein